MDERRRVTFRFGGDTEVQYVRELPTVGDFVTHRRAIWVVSRIEDDGLGGALVTCDRPTQGDRSDGPIEAAVHS